jgi:7-cyano-7-deazaguanine reductase
MSEGELSILGRDVRGPVERLECFHAPPHCTQVRFTSDELTSLCPITGRPDFSTVEIIYRPREHCVESKSLKHYLWSFRDKQAFAERLAGDIAKEVQRAAAPEWVKVVVQQHVRGGISLEAVAELRATSG